MLKYLSCFCNRAECYAGTPELRAPVSVARVDSCHVNLLVQ